MLLSQSNERTAIVFLLSLGADPVHDICKLGAAPCRPQKQQKGGALVCKRHADGQYNLHTAIVFCSQPGQCFGLSLFKLGAPP